MSNSKYVQVVSMPVDFTQYIIPQQEKNDILDILKYVHNFLEFNSFSCGYRF